MLPNAVAYFVCNCISAPLELCGNSTRVLQNPQSFLRFVISYSEEVFDFSSGQMTQAKAKHLKDSMCNEFSQVFTLCQFVMVRTPPSVCSVFIWKNKYDFICCVVCPPRRVLMWYYRGSQTYSKQLWLNMSDLCLPVMSCLEQTKYHC